MVGTISGRFEIKSFISGKNVKSDICGRLQKATTHI